MTCPQQEEARYWRPTTTCSRYEFAHVLVLLQRKYLRRSKLLDNATSKRTRARMHSCLVGCRDSCVVLDQSSQHPDRPPHPQAPPTQPSTLRREISSSSSSHECPRRDHLANYQPSVLLLQIQVCAKMVPAGSPLPPSLPAPSSNSITSKPHVLLSGIMSCLSLSTHYPTNSFPLSRIFFSRCPLYPSLPRINAKEQTFCRNPYNVTGLCLRSACPLANSRYATIHEEEGHCYLLLKTAERAHTPAKLWEKIRLPTNYAKALEKVSKELEFFPKYLQHRNKQRLTKIHQYLIRMRKLKLKVNKPKLVGIHKKVR